MLTTVRTGLQGSSRLPKIVLAIVGVWGAVAGLMLIHTLLATKQLHRRVTAITHTVSSIDQETGAISLMEQTNKTSADLLAASQPLTASLQDMKGVTSSLAAKVNSILAGSTTIQTNSQAIQDTVVAAGATAADINGSVKGIGKNLSSILATLRSTQTVAAQINASTKGINTAVGQLLPVVREIDTGIGASNQGIGAAALIVDALRADIGNILATMPDIAKHANSIDCHSALINLLGLVSGSGSPAC
jgi:ABC-type transporter Mla subunit MlaD